MQKSMCWIATLMLVAAVGARADDQAEMKALVDKAIKAAGGEAKLAKFAAHTFKGKGKFYGTGEGVDYTGDWAVQQPDKQRVQIETGGDMKFIFVRVVNGDKLWLKLGDQVTQVNDKEEIAEAREASYVSWVTSLVPLKDKAFQLAPLGELKVDGKPAVGVRVSHKNHRDVNLYFDKDKGLLVKAESIVRDVMAGGKELTQVFLYSDYKEKDGAQLAMKLVINRDGKKYVDVELTEVEPKEKLDDALFGKP